MTRREALAAAACLGGAVAFGAPQRANAAARTLDPILGYGDWLDVRPTPESLQGRVVLVDVFTFACWNCANVTPNLRSLHHSKPSSDLVIIGVHTPETPYERERVNVVENLRRLGITWPVAIDNSSHLWNIYGVSAWPTQMIFDRTGRLHTTVVGDSQDRDVDKAIASLI